MVVGDGGFQMTMCELATIVQEKMKINIAIINNGFLGMVRQWQEFFYDKRYVATPLVAPDFVSAGQCFRHSRRAYHQPQEVVPMIRAGAQIPDSRSARLPRGAGGLRLSHGAGGGSSLHEMIRRPTILW